MSISPISCLLSNLWEICDSYLPKSEVLNFWTAFGNPEKGFERTSARIYRLFQEKVDSLPAGHPCTDWFYLRRLYLEKGLKWRIEESLKLFEKAEDLGSMSNKMVITKETIPDSSNFQYYVNILTDKADQIQSKIPLGEPQSHDNSIATISPKEFVMFPECYFKSHLREQMDSVMTCWRLTSSEDRPESYECVATSEILHSPLSMRRLSRELIVCSLKERWIMIFNLKLERLFAFQVEESAFTIEALPDNRFIVVGHDTIGIWALRKSEGMFGAILEKRIPRVNQVYYSNVAVMQEGRIVYAVNHRKYTELCLCDVSLPGDKVMTVIHKLYNKEIIEYISILATGQIACGIANPNAKYVKIWPPDHSDHPRMIRTDCPFFFLLPKISDAGFAFFVPFKGFKIVQPILDETFFVVSAPQASWPCSIL